MRRQGLSTASMYRIMRSLHLCIYKARHHFPPFGDPRFAVHQATPSQNKRLHLRHLSPDCRELLDKARGMVEVNVVEDPRYRVADDKLA